MSKTYSENDRVEYYVIREGKRYHRIGYIKGRKRVLWSVRYFVCAADRTREVDVIKPSQIFGMAEYKSDKKKTTKSEENGINY